VFGPRTGCRDSAGDCGDPRFFLGRDDLSARRARQYDHVVAEGWVNRIAPSGTKAVAGVFTKGASFGEAVAFRTVPTPPRPRL
ncbi:MAG TPA: hypothetical protein VK146_15970, partial [Tabrizicola sp.]|nr:hypothetical protein [Tabrizicola sp.]